MNTYITLFLVGFFSSMTILTTYQAYGQEIRDGINEDQVIICVNGHVVEKSGNICHVYNADDLDWYQDSTDGSFFNEDDSFDMEVID